MTISLNFDIILAVFLILPLVHKLKNGLLFFFVLVGTWRSASNLAGQTYQEKAIYANVAWSWLTKFILLVALVQVLYPYYLSLI